LLRKPAGIFQPSVRAAKLSRTADDWEVGSLVPEVHRGRDFYSDSPGCKVNAAGSAATHELTDGPTYNAEDPGNANLPIGDPRHSTLITRH